MSRNLTQSPDIIPTQQLWDELEWRLETTLVADFRTFPLAQPSEKSWSHHRSCVCEGKHLGQARVHVQTRPLTQMFKGWFQQIFYC